MFLLVSVRHVGVHPGEHQHGVSIHISWSKTFLRISRIRNIPLSWILARVFVYVPPFISQILDFIYWTVLIFILIYFERRDSENQQSKNYTSNFLLDSVLTITEISKENPAPPVTLWRCTKIIFEYRIFFLTFFKGYRCNQFAVITRNKISHESPRLFLDQTDTREAERKIFCDHFRSSQGRNDRHSPPNAPQ